MVCPQEPVQNCKKVPHEVCYTRVERVAREVCGAYHGGHGEDNGYRVLSSGHKHH